MLDVLIIIFILFSFILTVLSFYQVNHWNSIPLSWLAFIFLSITSVIISKWEVLYCDQTVAAGCALYQYTEYNVPLMWLFAGLATIVLIYALMITITRPMEYIANPKSEY